MGNTPNIRFKGFTNDWEQRKLGDVFQEYSEKNHPELPALTIIQGGGTVLREESERKLQYDKSSLAGYKMVREDDFIVHLRSFEGGLEKSNHNGLISPAYHTFHGDEVDSRFYYPYFRSYEFIKHKLVPHVYGIRDGRSIDIDGMKTIEIPWTSYEEQKKIGDYIESLDTLITLHQRKLFLNFAKRNDWEQRKVLDLLIEPVTDGPHETPELVKKGVPFISVDAIVDNKIDFNRKRGDISEEYDAECCKKYKPQLHDVYLVKSGSTVGKVAIVETTERFNIWSPLAAMRCGEKTDPYFLYVLLQTDGMQAQISDKASNGTQPNLSMRELEKFDVQVPQNTDEQKAIGDYFINLDHLITLHRRAYYNKKGGLTNVHNDNQQHYAIL